MRKTYIPRPEAQMINGHKCSWWANWGLLQTMTATYKVKGEPHFVLDLNEEWKPIRFGVQAIEVVRKGTEEIQAAISGDDARKHGKPIQTPNGARWAIPVQYWSKEAVPLMKCIPCAVDKHDECVVDTGESVRTEPCSCSGQHGGRKKKIVKRRKVAG